MQKCSKSNLSGDIDYVFPPYRYIKTF